MRFGRFSNTPAQPFGRRGAGEREHPAVDSSSLGNPRRERPAAPADRVPEPADGAGLQAYPRREASDRGAAASFEQRPERPLDRAPALAPSVDAGGPPLARESGDGDDRFAGLASPSPLAAELAGSHEREAPPRNRSRAAETTGERGRSGAGAEQSYENDRPDGDVPIDEIDDIAVTIGRVVGIHGPVLWGTLYDDEDNTAASAARMGALVSLRGPESRVFGVVNALRRERDGGGTQGERTVFEIQTLGEIPTTGPDAAAAGFQRGVSRYPPLGAPVTTVTIRDLAKVYARPRTSNVHIGRLRHNQKVPAFVVTDSLLGKHFAVLGTTGTGKSCAVTVILRSILAEHPNGHVVLLDPHNEYASAFADMAELLNPSNLQLPYWLLNFEEIAHILVEPGEQRFTQLALLKDAIVQAKRAMYPEDAYLTVDTPIPYRLSDLISALQEGMGKFNKADGAASYLSLISRIEGLRSDRRYAFMFESLAVRDNMRQILAQLLRIPAIGKPITIIDISGLPSEVVDVVVSVLFRLVFELAAWSDRGAAPPVLLVCEEAHRYVPQDDVAAFAPTKRVISRIAKEGRKYGVTLCLVSQRPSELAIGSLAQCNTVFALRLTNEHDQSFVARALPENARWLVESLPSLNTQEAVVVGDGVTVPVHIRFNDLDPEHRPSSADPSFAVAWRRDPDESFLERAIERWRRQTR
jgi:DNA helicase HerA-like ATPase